MPTRSSPSGCNAGDLPTKKKIDAPFTPLPCLLSATIPLTSLDHCSSIEHYTTRLGHLVSFVSLQLLYQKRHTSEHSIIKMSGSNPGDWESAFNCFSQVQEIRRMGGLQLFWGTWMGDIPCTTSIHFGSTSIFL